MRRVALALQRSFPAMQRHSSSLQSCIRKFSSSEPLSVVSFTVRGPGPLTRTIRSPVGRPLLRVLQASGVDGIIAACNGRGECSTCHIVLEPEAFDAIPPPSVAEEDLLDVAADAGETSRLACQCKTWAGLNGSTITLPDFVINHMDGDGERISLKTLAGVAE